MKHHQGDAEGAFASYQAALDIAERLVPRQMGDRAAPSGRGVSGG